MVLRGGFQLELFMRFFILPGHPRDNAALRYHLSEVKRDHTVLKVFVRTYAQGEDESPLQLRARCNIDLQKAVEHLQGKSLVTLRWWVIAQRLLQMRDTEPERAYPIPAFDDWAEGLAARMIKRGPLGGTKHEIMRDE